MPILKLSPGLDIFYSDPAPDGYPCVILLHGLGATNESWGYQIPALLDQRFRVIAPDIRGFGKSTYPGGSHHIADIASGSPPKRITWHLAFSPAQTRKT
jgi:pimeloyl-ACP methyl ester carboxylesterase